MSTVHERGRWVRRSASVRRARILDAAARVLPEGPEEVTIADVAAAAGISPATVYLYFDSKPRLIAALQHRYGEALAGRAAVVEGGGDRLDRIATFLGSAYELLCSERDLHRALLRDLRCDYVAVLAPTVEVMTSFIAEGRQAGEFQVADPESAATFFAHGIHGLLLHALERGEARANVVNRGVALARRLLT